MKIGRKRVEKMNKVEKFEKARKFESLMKKTVKSVPTLRTLKWQEIKNGKTVFHTDLTAW